MKKILMLIAACNIVGCAALDSRGDCYFAEQPTQYLVNSQGKYIDLNGQVVNQPVLNPYYAQYQKCYPAGVDQQQPVITNNAMQALLKDSYQVNGKTYRLAEPRRVKDLGLYVDSFFKAVNHDSYLKQEIFIYHNDRATFPALFLNDLNRDEGKFEAKSINGQNYIIGKNDRGAYVIYLVKSVLNQHISIIQYIVKEPFNPQEIATIVKDLSLV